MRNYESIGIITFPLQESGNIPLNNLIEILNDSFEVIYVITGNEGKVSKKNKDKTKLHSVHHANTNNLVKRIINYISSQIRLALLMFKLRRNVRTWVFLFGESLILPMLMNKLLQGNSILSFTGSAAKVSKIDRDPLSIISAYLQRLNFYLANRIVLYSDRLIEELELQRFKKKIYISHEHFIDTKTFYKKIKLDSRTFSVGFIGRLTKAKGALNFVHSIPLIIDKFDNNFLNQSSLSFMIGGDGDKKSEIDSYINGLNPSRNVSICGWISRDDLPVVLNQLKLLVLPSYTEGLPNIILEAMSCGTLVLAPSIGAIPDIIKNYETGFLLPDISSECIAKYVTKVLINPSNNEISDSAAMFIQNHFTYDVAVNGYMRALDLK